MDTVRTKMCNVCKVVKELDHFSLTNKKKYPNYACKPCTARMARERKKKQSKSIEEVLAWKEEMKLKIQRGEI